MNQARIMLIVCVMSAVIASPRDQPRAQRDSSASTPSTVYKLEELTWPQIAAFDRERTLFILPVGVLEEHGPHLPIAADTLGVMYEANRAAPRISRALRDWNVVVMPALNYGNGGANQLGDMLVHPGTYQIRQSTVRALVADIGGQVAQNGFKWIFVLNGHGAPAHSIALNEASDFVSETFHVTMLHLTGLFRADPAIQARGAKMRAKFFTRAEFDSIGMDLHAGVSETSAMLVVRPDLVQSTYRTLPSQSGQSFDALRKITTAAGWQGYLSSPAKATAAYGRAVEDWWVEGFTDLILRAVRGENMLSHPRDPDRLPPAVAPILEKALANEAAFQAKLENWLVERRKR